MQPYQEEGRAIQQSKNIPANIARNVGAAAFGFGVPKVFSKIAPFLSNFIPRDLAMKGLSKVDKRLGNFISQSLANGHEQEEVLDFVKDKTGFGKQEQSSDIRSSFPNLFSFIDNQIAKGADPDLAGDLAYKAGYSKEIKDLEKKTGQFFGDVLYSIYNIPQKTQQTQPSQAMQQQAQPSQGQGQQALMAMLEKVNQTLGNR